MAYLSVKMIKNTTMIGNTMQHVSVNRQNGI